MQFAWRNLGFCYGRLHQEVTQHPTSPRLHNASLPRVPIYPYLHPLSPFTIHSDSSPSEWRTVRPFGSHSSQVSMKVHPENFDRYSPNIFSRFRGRLFRPSCTNRGSTASTYFQNVSAPPPRVGTPLLSSSEIRTEPRLKAGGPSQKRKDLSGSAVYFG